MESFFKEIEWATNITLQYYMSSPNKDEKTKN